MGGTHCCCSFAIVGALIFCGSLHTVFDLKVIQINLLRHLFRKHLHFKFEKGYNDASETKNLSKRWICSLSEHSNHVLQDISLILKESRWFDNVWLAWSRQLQSYAPNYRGKSEEYQVSSAFHCHHPNRFISIKISSNVPDVTNILQNIWLTLEIGKR